MMAVPQNRLTTFNSTTTNAMQACKCCLQAADNASYSLPTIAELRSSAHAGCKRCRIIAEGVSRFAYLFRVKEDQDPIQHIITFRTRPRTLIVYTSGERLSDKRPYYDLYSFQFFIREDAIEVLPDFFVKKGIVLDSSSNACFNTIKDWMHKCSVEHDTCGSLATSGTKRFLPARLVDVRKVRLMLAEDIVNERNIYAALSHSWGLKSERRKPIPKLQKKNVRDRRKAISWDELTKTFQDAIAACRQLDIRYLWIDSLCIIQDDGDDWVVQSSQMAKIYGEANIIVSATRSATGDAGFFHLRTGAQNVSVDGLENGTVTIRPQPKHANFFTNHKPDFSQDPLFERGWCFQERLLARRIIHFTEQEAVWECNEALWCECQSISDEAIGRNEGNYGKEFKSKFRTLLQSKDRWATNSAWLNILEGYSARKLTFESDRLPALSGVAQQIATPERGKYLAGMWEGDLPNSLLWCLPFMNPEVRRSIQRLPGIPTWAWPSVGVSITPHFASSFKLKSLETIAFVVETKPEPKTADPFGQVSGGHIVLRAPVMEVTLGDDIANLKSLINVQDCEDKWRFIPDSFVDLPANGTTVLCVGIEFDTHPGRTNGFSCLILRTSDPPEEFRRIGQANCPSRWRSKAKMRIVKIV